jgi:predicted CopG family antitoxin
MSRVVIESSGTRGRRSSRFKRIVISEHNYLALKRLGYAGDSFNDVISKLLRIERRYQEMKKQQNEEEQQQESSDDNSSNSDSEFLFSPTSAEIFSEKQNKKQLDEFVRLLRGRRRGKCSMGNQTSQQESNR